MNRAMISYECSYAELSYNVCRIEDIIIMLYVGVYVAWHSKGEMQDKEVLLYGP